MTLDQWLTDRPKLTLAAFGRVVGGVDHSTVSRWRRKRLVPSWRQMVAIYFATDGAVTPNDWLDEPQAALHPTRDPRQPALLVA